ncbi:MAG: single-stranded-DNA-specific exonuclease [Candidatus Diapherotrites archaeon]|nr:single-stranded-DNA-specific exonuclease [Candidatus Diapherotrites archaeon]MDN5366792.1 single-stranded-DNA-specific exonuclease [Candidatus Diapherotrites archaeon]
MEIPGNLKRAIRTFRDRLDDGLYHVEHDIDMDGFASGIITTVALRRMGFDAHPYATERDKCFVPEKGALVFTDIALDGEPVEIVQGASKSGRNVYAIDHHPWRKDVEKKLHAYVNPHFTDVPSPSQWNTGFLAYLTFRELVSDYDWLAAISIYTDHCIAPWNEFLIQRFGYDKVKRAGDLLSAYIAVIEDLSELDYILLNDIHSLNDVLSRSEFIDAENKFEGTVKKYVEDPKEQAVIWDERRKIIVRVTEEKYRQINSIVSTRVSTLPEYRDWIVIVLGMDRNGTLKGSFRCQEWEKRGIHLGELAKRIAVTLGGEGGGHPMAAGMRIPNGNLNSVLSVINEVIK